jgi:acid stress-induced BolA-like protein IbaG/YrbA
MDADSVQQLVNRHLDNCEVSVEGQGNHFDILVVGEVFAGLRPVAKQQLVYAALGEQIADGSIHAVNIKTFTPEQWRAQGNA